MSDFDLVIRNGTVATASDVMRCDVGIRSGRIAALGLGLGRGAQELDAVGLLVLPGGIDSHCHIDQVSSSGVRTADDFRSGSVSAAFGGTTTIIPFAAQHKGQSLRAAVEDYHRCAEGRAVIDYAFHLIVSDPTEQVLGQELPALVRDGYTSLKIYMTYEALRLDDRQVLDVLALARREGAMVMVHAESHDLIGWLTDRLLDAGHRAPKDHAVARPSLAESEATFRAITMAELIDVPILVVHVSAPEAAAQIRRARERGLRIYGETCPQYLFLTAGDLDRPGFEGAKYCCSPPPRDKDGQRAMWRGLLGGTFQVFSSDHAAYRFDDPNGKKAAGPEAPFNRIPMGVPGIETRLPLLFSEGVGKGRMTVSRFVALSATNAARMYGLFPRKGSIAIGADADIALWDPGREVTISQAMLHDNVDYTPYEGMTVRGWPITTLSRGEIVCANGELTAAPGRGRFLACDSPEMARPAGRPVVPAGIVGGIPADE